MNFVADCTHVGPERQWTLIERRREGVVLAEDRETDDMWLALHARDKHVDHLPHIVRV